MNPIDFLSFILNLIKNCKDNNKILRLLESNKLLHPLFEERYILNNVDYGFTLIKTLSKDKEQIEFYLESTDGSPYKIEIVFIDKWYLKSFTFQCQSCFGYDTNCDVCGGSGWGVL